VFWQLQVALKCADIGNPCRSWKLSRRWGEMICQEFYLQGMLLRDLPAKLLSPLVHVPWQAEAQVHCTNWVDSRWMTVCQYDFSGSTKGMNLCFVCKEHVVGG